MLRSKELCVRLYSTDVYSHVVVISLWDLASPSGLHISMVYPSYANAPAAAIVNVFLFHCVEVYDIAVDGRLLVVVDPRPSAKVAPVPYVDSILTLRMLVVEGL